MKLPPCVTALGLGLVLTVVWLPDERMVSDSDPHALWDGSLFESPL